MGLFDYVELPLRCPSCGYKEKKYEWQTKALENGLLHYKVGDSVSTSEREIEKGSIEIHGGCPKCDKSIIAKAKISDSKITGKISNIKIE